jgi:hypothetical protein
VPEINRLASVFSREDQVRLQSIEINGFTRKTPDKRGEDVGHCINHRLQVGLVVKEQVVRGNALFAMNLF